MDTRKHWHWDPDPLPIDPALLRSRQGERPPTPAEFRESHDPWAFVGQPLTDWSAMGGWFRALFSKAGLINGVLLVMLCALLWALLTMANVFDALTAIWR